MNNLTWHFPSTDNGDEDGINDPLRETFEGDHERYVARESIQNSIDARRDYNNPVKVRFERFMIPVTDIPGIIELKDVLHRASEYAKGQSRADEFYQEAQAMLEEEAIPVLKVSDFNTVGLSGGDHDHEGGWYKLIRASGVNSMHGVGGGSFGIGKGAPFAASGIRTVFYSTQNTESGRAFQGKARLSSFKNNDGDVRRGIGQFGIREGRGVSSVRGEERIPPFFRRVEQGTDIYIVGYRTKEEDWRSLLLNSLLNNFWAAIHFNDLDVELAEGDDVISVDESNLDELMAEYASDRNDSYSFYKAVKDPSYKFNETLPLLKEVSLYVKTAEGFPKSVQMMRKSKMVVMTNNYRVLPEPYAAVFICESEQGNRLLREMEPPAHDEWDPSRNRGLGRVVYKEFTDWIKDSLRSLAEDKDNIAEDVPDLGQYLPETEERDDTNPYLGTLGQATDHQTDTETGREVGSTKEETSVSESAIKDRQVVITHSFGRGEDDGRLGTKRRKNKTHTDKIDDESEGPLKRIDTSLIKLRSREIVRNGEKIYQAVITSEKDDSGALKIITVGDDSDYPAELAEVTDQEGNSLKIDGAFISEISLTQNESLKFYIKLKNPRRYVIGVESYER